MYSTVITVPCLVEYHHFTPTVFPYCATFKGLDLYYTGVGFLECVTDSATPLVHIKNKISHDIMTGRITFYKQHSHFWKYL